MTKIINEHRYNFHDFDYDNNLPPHIEECVINLKNISEEINTLETKKSELRKEIENYLETYGRQFIDSIAYFNNGQNTIKFNKIKKKGSVDLKALEEALIPYNIDIESYRKKDNSYYRFDIKHADFNDEDV